MKFLFLMSLLMVSGSAFADLTLPVFVCNEDANGDRLSVSLTASPGPLGGYGFYVNPKARGNPKAGSLTKIWNDPTYPVTLRGKGVMIQVPTVAFMDLPVTEVRVSYKIQRERPVIVVCKKGPAFNSLFMR